MIRAWRKRRRCAHVHLTGIYGDAIHALGARLMCLDCDALLEGPVALADWRKAEARLLHEWRLRHGLPTSQGHDTGR